MAERIAVGIITYSGHKKIRKIFFDYLASLTYPDLHFIFVTNSGAEDKKDLEAHATRAGIKSTILLNEHKLEKLDYLVDNRNIIRDYFLTKDFDWIFFLDSDCVGAPNVIESLLAHKKRLVTGWYLGGVKKDGETKVLPVAYIIDKKNTSDKTHLSHLSISAVLKQRFGKIAAAGLGCCLVKREILKDISFRREDGTEDILFFKDARDKGFSLWLDTQAKFVHYKFDPGDKRNKYFDPRNYVLDK